MINRKLQLLAISFLTACVSACDQGPKSGRGFTLPEGDIEAGEKAFVRFRCGDCHSINNREDLREGIDPIMTVPLGGTTTQISTYGQLVASVINPSHKISQKYVHEPSDVGGVSPMRNYNDVMTVTEMSDIVVFLQEQYELEPYSETKYRGYPIR